MGPPGHPVLEFTMHPGILKGDSDLFTPAGGALTNDELKFCVRLGLWAEGSDAQEVNFLETIATISLSMDGSFTTEDINVGPKDRSGTQAQKTYKVEAALCNTAPGGDGEFKQGEIIQVSLHLRVQRLRMELYSMPWNHSPGSARVSQIRRPVVKMTHQALRSMRDRVLMSKLTKSPFPLSYTRPSLPPPEQLQLLDLLPWDMLVVV